MTQAKRKTISDIRMAKNAPAPLVCLTAYSAPMAEILDPHCDMMLVGDSMGMALYGMENTLGVTLEMIAAHGKAVMRRANNACVIVDMPYGTYEESPQTALKNARWLLEQSGCDGIKMEGGREMADTIRTLTQAGIAVMAHIGLKPQSVIKEGGYRIKGRTQEEIDGLLADARKVEEAGAFALLIEGTIEDVASKITRSVNIPTVGIGASPACDGQILVTEDMLGLLTGHSAKFVRKYSDLAEIISTAVQDYAQDVRARRFPDENHVYRPKKNA